MFYILENLSLWNITNNKNLNHNYYRYKNEVGGGDYLELPQYPSTEIYYEIDINNTDFYTKLKSVLNGGESDCNYLVISFGSDLENIDLAQKILEKRNEWGLNNLIIFVKVRKFHKEQTLLEQENCFFIGNEKNVVYNVSKILEDDIQKMAKMRDEI